MHQGKIIRIETLIYEHCFQLQTEKIFASRTTKNKRKRHIRYEPCPLGDGARRNTSRRRCKGELKKPKRSISIVHVARCDPTPAEYSIAKRPESEAKPDNPASSHGDHCTHKLFKKNLLKVFRAKK